MMTLVLGVTQGGRRMRACPSGRAGGGRRVSGEGLRACYNPPPEALAMPTSHGRRCRRCRRRIPRGARFCPLCRTVNLKPLDYVLLALLLLAAAFAALRAG